MTRKPRSPLRKIMDQQIARMRIYGQLFRKTPAEIEVPPRQSELEIEGNPNETDGKNR